MNTTANFETALARLSEISNIMNDSGLPLEESLKLYAEAVSLAGDCKRQIQAAEQEIERINAGGSSTNASAEQT